MAGSCFLAAYKHSASRRLRSGEALVRCVAIGNERDFLQVSSVTLRNEPRRLARVVLIETKRSTWFDLVEYVGTKRMYQHGR